MSNLALKIVGLGKQYRIGKQERYRTFRDTITDAVTAPMRRAAGLLRGNAAAAANLVETIWALKDVSFEVEHGEVVGIIGRNGAGKSTLLKILSRITEPTTGYADVYGRVGALLEVGTGFHPELTGRENIYLNGAILGMSRQEIRRKFDEIVEFAGVEKFIDTPVKHYSSGMGLRLGFAVAAHLEPEILIVDEVLAVGDAEFQKKCMGKMGEVAGEGRTVLFVSHNMAAIRTLCNRAIVLREGQLWLDDESNSAIVAYQQQEESEKTTISLADRTDRKGSLIGRYISFSFRYHDTQTLTIPMGATVTVCADFLLKQDIRFPVFGVFFKDLTGQTILRSYSHESTTYTPLSSGEWQLMCTFYNLPLMHGYYSISLYLGTPNQPIDFIDNVATVYIEPSDVYGTGILPSQTNSGFCYTQHSWLINGNSNEVLEQ